MADDILNEGSEEEKKDNLPDIRTVIITSLFFLIPFSILLSLMFSGFTPQYSASISILAAFILLFFNIKNIFNFQLGTSRFFEACVASGRQISLIGSIIICASIIIGVLSMPFCKHWSLAQLFTIWSRLCPRTL